MKKIVKAVLTLIYGIGAGVSFYDRFYDFHDLGVRAAQGRTPKAENPFAFCAGGPGCNTVPFYYFSVGDRIGEGCDKRVVILEEIASGILLLDDFFLLKIFGKKCRLYR